MDTTFTLTGALTLMALERIESALKTGEMVPTHIAIQ